MMTERGPVLTLSVLAPVEPTRFRAPRDARILGVT